MSDLTLDQFPIIYNDIGKERADLQRQLESARNGVTDAIKRNQSKAQYEQIAEIEDRLSRLDRRESDLKKYEAALLVERDDLLKKYEKIKNVVEDAQGKEAALLKKLDSAFQELEKLGRELMAVRTFVVKQIEGSGVHGLVNKLPRETVFLSNEHGRLGRVAWDVKRFCDTWAILRGRRNVSIAPPSWD